MMSKHLPLLALLVFSLLLIASAPPRQHATIRFHRTASELDSNVFAVPVAMDRLGQPIYMETLASISERNVKHYQFFPADDGTYGAAFQLDTHSSLALEGISIEDRGKYLFAFVNGRMVGELLIDRRVNDGIIFVPSGLTNEDIEKIEKHYRH